MNLIVFGTGIVFERRKKELFDNKELNILAFADNDTKKWGKKLYNIPIIAPKDICNFDYDKILITSNIYFKEITEQLLELGMEESQIIFWEELNLIVGNDEIEHYYVDTRKNGKKKFLIITTPMDYTGAPLAAIYLAKAAKKLGYYTELFCPEIDSKLLEECNKQGISISLSKKLPFIANAEKEYIKQFDFVVINVFLMMVSALAIPKDIPMFWWLHENAVYSNEYETTLVKYNKYIKDKKIDVNICAVSKKAEKNFHMYFPAVKSRELVLGISDSYEMKNVEKMHEKVIFAIVGFVAKRKGHHILMEAVEMLKEKYQNFEVWIIGGMEDSKYGKEIRKSIEKNSSFVKYKGLLTRKQMNEIYPDIDVVVCASLEETLSMAVIEGMLNQKVCITTDATGVADYIESGKNGLICKSDDAKSLSECMDYVITHPEECEKMARNARKRYEEFFTIEAFAERLKDVINVICNE